MTPGMNKRFWRARVALLCVVPVVAALAAPPAAAQFPTPIPTIIPTQPAPSPSPSPSPPPSPPPKDADPSTPPSDQTRTPAPTSPTSSSSVSPGPAASGVPVLTVPNILRTPSQTTARLIEILGPVADSGLPIDQAVVQAAAPFPVAGQAWFSHDFGFPRFVPVPHLHEGTDIFADFGTPIVASGPGTMIGFGTTSVGGLSAWVAGDDGTSYYYSHLLAFREGLAVGEHLGSGTVIGYVGNSGNAITTPPHLHFEIHPAVKDRKGRIVASGVSVLAAGVARTNTPAVDPKPYLDRWLMQAEQQAQLFVERHLQRYAGLTRQVHFSRRIDAMAPQDRSSVSLNVLLTGNDLAREGVRRAGLGALSGGVRDEQLAAVRLAVQASSVKLASFTGRRLYGVPVYAMAGA